MKKRVTSILCAFALLCGMLVIPAGEAKASDIRKEDAKTVLTLNSASTGKLNTARSVNGAYLMEGDCSITKAGRGKIYVYASTTANFDVEYVGVIIYVERYLEEEPLSVRARDINDQMKLAAAYAIADLITDADRSEENIIPGA